MADSLWEDRDVRFDLPRLNLNMRGGEKILDILNSVEDSKGNIGDIGRLIVTNLRIIWHSVTSTKISLCNAFFYCCTISLWLFLSGSFQNFAAIGWSSILLLTQKTTLIVGLSYYTKLFLLLYERELGECEVIQLLTKTPDMKFEFIFTNLLPRAIKDFSSVITVHRSYTSTRSYRELKLRGAVINGRQLQVLPLEKVISNVNGVWNLSSDQGTLGTFIITNVRLVWFSDTKEQFNISIPYLHVVRIKARDSKFGRALVVECSECSGGYVLGFRVDPREKLEEVLKELSSLLASYRRRPIFGVEYEREQYTPDMKFEFIFTNLLPRAIKDFSSVITVHRSYTSTRSYRELKLRGAVINGRQLQVLPLEKVISNVNGVWNLSSDQKILSLALFEDIEEHGEGEEPEKDMEVAGEEPIATKKASPPTNGAWALTVPRGAEVPEVGTAFELAFFLAAMTASSSKLSTKLGHSSDSAPLSLREMGVPTVTSPPRFTDIESVLGIAE
ncbi:hypothetical protein J437_LFUL003684 [Ladona fulva]|uniref:BBSome complex member BBS5 PH domain-containing protein n=1 Tax=Ladona fulva TaxID=123851 RepID=A0A8K0JVH0_LADFU|nr:hypothetical protein J437_LFUL003684 [Ladona fulva]